MTGFCDKFREKMEFKIGVGATERQFWENTLVLQNKSSKGKEIAGLIRL